MSISGSLHKRLKNYRTDGYLSVDGFPRIGANIDVGSGQVQRLDVLLYVVVEGGLPELLIGPNLVVLDARVGKLDDAGAEFPAKGRGQRQEGGGHALPTHGKVVLEGAVHEAHDQVELLVLQHGLVAHHVLRQLSAQRQAHLLGLQGPQYGRECFASVRNFIFENTVDAVLQNL
jgi:hypothetical protein